MKKNTNTKSTTLNWKNNDKVHHFRLINGDELIGKIIDETDYSVEIFEPLVVSEQEIDRGKSSIVLTNYTPFADGNTINIDRSHIITIVELHPIVVEYYNNSLIFCKKNDTQMLMKIDAVNTLMRESTDIPSISMNHLGSNVLN